MTAATAPNEGAAPRETAVAETARVPSAGWLVIARKEFGDHVVSIRFLVLLVVLGLAVAIPLYFAADRIRSLATAAVTAQQSGQLAIFLALFTVGPQDIALLRVDTFVSIVAPLLGLAFAFDAVNGERSEGTLPRLLAQPIYRDDVINGKFAAGLAVISVVLVSVVLFITGFGMIRLALVPHGQEVVRLIAWLIATFLYVAVWLAFGLLLSVAIRRAATSALIGFGVWLLLTIFGPLIVSLVSGVFAPSAAATAEEQLSAIQIQDLIQRLLPSNLYSEISTAILQPNVTTIAAPGSLGQFEQAQQQIPGLLTLDQSLLLVWPQTVALVALTVVCFAAAYVLFMRQEVRA
jgi:ABC-2 type transport system permease protein